MASPARLRARRSALRTLGPFARTSQVLAMVAAISLVSWHPWMGWPRLTPTAGHAALPTDCGKSGASCVEEVVGVSGWRMQVYRNVPLSGSPRVTRAVIVIHGTGRNAAGYFASMMRAADQAGVSADTAVVSPWFKTSEDNPDDGEAVWTNDSWKIGNGAQTPRGLSSFEAMDQLLATLADKARFPNLRRITLAGHSAGGQFVQRYAALGQAPDGLPNVAINYVPANPSSYLYFDPRRPTASGALAVPPKACDDYDSYKYGLANRSGYTAQLSPEQALSTYAHRPVTIINGGSDTTDNGDLDQDCGAMAQGPNRAERGAAYQRYIQAIAPTARQQRIVIAGVDHNGEAIFTSAQARDPLFGTGNAAAGEGRAE